MVSRGQAGWDEKDEKDREVRTKANWTHRSEVARIIATYEDGS